MFSNLPVNNTENENIYLESVAKSSENKQVLIFISDSKFTTISKEYFSNSNP